MLTSSSLEGILYFSRINEFFNAEENPLSVYLDCCPVPRHFIYAPLTPTKELLPFKGDLKDIDIDG